jgi:U4/U6.U5 tri-snRNP-associated protein 2
MNNECPFLHTVQREFINLERQRICSVTLSPQNVYACLVCGRFFSGRGKQTEAFTHSVQALHHVFMNLQDGTFWCLPDGYEVRDSSLSDIRDALNPQFTDKDIQDLNSSTKLSVDVHGGTFLPGFIGMNNLGKTDYISSTILSLAHVKPLRDFFLRPENYSHCALLSGVSKEQLLVYHFGDLLRRLWFPRALKATVSPHTFINVVSECSRHRYGVVGKAVEAGEFLAWLLNSLHIGLTTGPQHGGDINQRSETGKRRRPSDSDEKNKRSIITELFQGELEVTLLSSDLEDEKFLEEAKKKAEVQSREVEKTWSDVLEEKKVTEVSAPLSMRLPRTSRIPFRFLSLELPPSPLFNDAKGSVAIPQIPVYALLTKYDGITVTESLRGQYRERKKFKIINLPRYLLFSIKRFSRNAFFMDKNPTIVSFPISNLELKPFTTEGSTKETLSTKYDLLSNVCHVTPPYAVAGTSSLKDNKKGAATRLLSSTSSKDPSASITDDKNNLASSADSIVTDPLARGYYKVHLRRSEQSWYEVQDLSVTEILPQQIGVSESLIVLFERN